MFKAPENLEGQVFDGIWESDDCWDFSGVGIMEIVLGNLFPTFSKVAQNFFISNNYCDAQGNFALSRRYIAVLSGVKNNGNSQIQFWYDVQKYGMIPRSVLDFTPTSSQDPNYAAFVTDFFNPASVTQAMKDLGQQFLIYVGVSANNIDPSQAPIRVLQTPLQVGIAIVKNGLWNAPTVKWDGSTQVQHAVALLGFNPDGTKVILDSYIPWVKTLSTDYPLPVVTLPSITVNNLQQIQFPITFATILFNILRKIGLMS